MNENRLTREAQAHLRDHYAREHEALIARQDGAHGAERDALTRQIVAVERRILELALERDSRPVALDVPSLSVA